MLEVVQNKPLDPAAIYIGPLQSVITREGQTISFDASKIVKAIERAGQATEEFGLDEA